jgi:hypothetical protein
MNEYAKKDKEPCLLQKARGIEAWCSRESCIYWRLLEPQDVEMSNEKGCGLQHYGIVGDITPEIAEWLTDMKKRLENTTPDAAKARITFRRREEDK